MGDAAGLVVDFGVPALVDGGNAALSVGGALGVVAGGVAHPPSTKASPAQTAALHARPRCRSEAGSVALCGGNVFIKIRFSMSEVRQRW